MARILLTHVPDMLENYYGLRALAEMRKLGEVRLNQTGKVLESSSEGNPYGGRWLHTWWLWVYCPVRKDARAGQHSGYGAKELLNRAPCPAISRRVWGIQRRSSLRMSSAMITTTFGRPAGAVESGERTTD